MAEWLTLTAAAERLGWRVRKVESRARREGWQRRRSNRGPAMEYLVPEAVLAERADPAAEMTESSADPDVAEQADPWAELAEARAACARAQGELAAEQRGNAELVGELREALALERARADRLEAALVEARRPWLARVLEGLRRKG